MISDDMLIKYRETFRLPIYYTVPDGMFLVVVDNGDKAYQVTEQDDDAFLAKLIRSRETGQNLFFDGSKLFDPYPDKNILY